jgi:hypothetical protein
MRGTIAKLPAVSQERLFSLQTDAGDMTAGGWADANANASAAYTAASNFDTNVFGTGGTAQAEANAIATAGGDACAVQKPKMTKWLTQQTETFHADLIALDAAQRAEWTAESKWRTAVLANISNRNINKSQALYIDEIKQNIIALITQLVWYWEQSAVLYDDSFSSLCLDTLGTGPRPPAQTTAGVDDCPDILKKASFDLSLGFFEINANCEQVSVTVQPECLGPFARVSQSRAGDTTVTVGAKAGVSLGPASAGVEAGAYITVHNGSISDAGVTANASAGAHAGPISLEAGSAGATASFANTSPAATSIIY